MIPVLLPSGVFCHCELNDWRRFPGDGGTIIACARCGAIAAITCDPGGTRDALGLDPGSPSLHKVTLTLCSLCLLGEGGQCHTPGCALWIKSAPDIRLSLEPWNDPAAATTADREVPE